MLIQGKEVKDCSFQDLIEEIKFLKNEMKKNEGEVFSIFYGNEIRIFCQNEEDADAIVKLGMGKSFGKRIVSFY